MGNAMQSRLASAFGIDPDAVSDDEAARIEAAMKRITAKLVGVAGRNNDGDTASIIEALELGIDQVLAPLEADPAAARAYKHGHSIGADVQFPGVQPAVQHNGTTPALALGGGTATQTAPTNQDPMDRAFSALRASNPTGADSLLNMLTALNALQQTDPVKFRLYSRAFVDLVDAATKPDHELSNQARAWKVKDVGGLPRLIVHDQALSDLTEAQNEAGRLRDVIQKLWSHKDVLQGAIDVATEISNGHSPTIPPANAARLADLIQKIMEKIDEGHQPAARPATPRAAWRPATRAPRNTP